MKSHSTSIQNNFPFDFRRHTVSKSERSAGFTLVEILIVISILTVISAMGLAVGIDTYQRYLLRSDTAVTASLLQKARISAMNNIGEANHGVYVCDTEKFIFYRGPSYILRNPSYDILIDKNKGVVITSCPAPDQFIFTALSGTTTGGVITLSSDVGNTSLTINNEGGINW